MTLTLHPYKLLPGELEARLEGGLLLLPGQLLRFEGEPSASGPVYGRVVAVRTLSPEIGDDKESGLVRVRLLYGTPSMTPQPVTVLTDAQMAGEVQRLLPETAQPIRFGASFTGDVSRLGPLTVIEGDDFLLKYEALMTLVRALEPYRRAVIVDPLGVSMSGEKLACFNAGEHLRLSLRDVGSKRFLDAFGALFPDTLRELGLRTLVNLLPASQEFMGFKSFFTLEGIAEAPLRNLILQNCHAIAAAGVFVDTPDEVLSLAGMLPEPVNAVDISRLQEPWKRLFYEEICRYVLEYAGNDVALVLVNPDNYLGALPTWLQRADASGMTLIALTSPYPTEEWQTLASNTMVVESRERVHLMGNLTLGLPVRFALPKDGLALALSAGQTHAAPEPPSVPSPLEPFLAAPVSLDSSSSSIQAVIAAAEATSSESSTAEEIPPSPVAEVPEISATSPPAPAAELAVVDFENTPEESPGEEHEHPEALLTAEPAAQVSGLGPAEADDFDFDPELDEQGEGPWGDAFERMKTMTSADLSEKFAGGMASWQISVTDEEQLEEHPGWHEGDGIDSYGPVPDEGEFPESAEPRAESYVGPRTEPHAELLSEATSAEAPVEPVRVLPEDRIAEETPTPPGLASDEEPAAETPETEGASGGWKPIEEEVPVYRKPLSLVETETHGFQVGEHVQHPTYGRGTVTKILPMDENVILNIAFDNVGKRLLDPALCVLTRESEKDAHDR